MNGTNDSVGDLTTNVSSGRSDRETYSGDDNIDIVGWY